MTTIAQLRKAALDLPEVDEGTHFGNLAFSVRGKGFVSVATPDIVQLQLPDDAVAELVDELPGAEPITRRDRVIGLGVPLSMVNGMQLNALVLRAWTWRAPRRLAMAMTAAQQAAPGAGDLPVSIGRPATRALLAAGLSTLDEVAARPRREVLDLHGVGPKAIRLLEEAIAERGGEWR